jgi:hypothetical protein
LWFTSMFSNWDAVTALFLTLFYHMTYTVPYNVRHATLLVALERASYARDKRKKRKKRIYGK